MANNQQQNDYEEDKKLTSQETGDSPEEVQRAWDEAAQDNAAGSSGQTLDEAVPGQSREETSLEDLRDVENASGD